MPQAGRRPGQSNGAEGWVLAFTPRPRGLGARQSGFIGRPRLARGRPVARAQAGHGAGSREARSRSEDDSYLRVSVARCRDQARAAKATTGRSHHAFTFAAWARIAVAARPITTRAATCQSSPTMKSYQNAPNALSCFMSR